jgi:hypothetical protein
MTRPTPRLWLKVSKDNDILLKYSFWSSVGLNGKKQRPSPETSHLPPLTSIPDIFTDIVRRMPELQKVAKHLNGRSLRVATMCSGTESPLLALGLISRAMGAIGSTFNVEHVFSCEIEPFKQAYIERNFSPPILFRDVCELGGSTAYVFYFTFSSLQMLTTRQYYRIWGSGRCSRKRRSACCGYIVCRFLQPQQCEVRHRCRRRVSFTRRLNRLQKLTYLGLRIPSMVCSIGSSAIGRLSLFWKTFVALLGKRYAYTFTSHSCYQHWPVDRSET